MKVVIGLSGGMDSTTVLYSLLASNKYRVTSTLSFDYGQRHSKELECAAATVAFLRTKGFNITHRVIKVPFGELTYKSALTSEVEVPEGHYAGENMKLTVAPNRNMIFVSIAASLAITENAILALGVHAGDHTIYPDCREEFIKAAEKAVKIGNWDSENFEIITPFLHRSKDDIAEAGKNAAEKLGITPTEIYKRTWTCYCGREKACGKCGSCVERLEAFEFAGIEDPIEYE